MQVEDGVSDDPRCPLLVPPGCHHQDGDPAAPGSPEHHLVSLHNALQGHHSYTGKVSDSNMILQFQPVVFGFRLLDAW